MTIDPAPHAPLALFLARKYGRTAPEPEAVLEVAFFALLGAARTFDPERGEWGPFASASVARAVRGEVQRQFREPRPEPLYRVTGGGEEVERRDLPSVAPHDGKSLMFASVRASVDALPGRGARLVRLRFGLDGEAMTLEAVGAEIGVTRERVRQLEKTAIARLRNVMTRAARPIEPGRRRTA